MDREDIIRMAIDAGATDCANPDKWDILEISDRSLERFAALVAAHDREECAKACEDSDTCDLYDPNGFAANLIRARGEK